MSNSSLRRKAIEARRARFVEHIRNGLTVAEIAEQEGVEEDYAKALRKEIAADEGLPILPPRVLTPEQRAARLPYGMTKASALFRGKLSTVVYWLKHHPVDLAHEIGMTQKAQKQNENNPHNYDWKISQLERLAKLEGKPFVQFMLEMLK